MNSSFSHCTVAELTIYAQRKAELRDGGIKDTVVSVEERLSVDVER